MYSKKNQKELLSIEIMVYGNLKTQSNQLSIPDRVEALFMSVFGHTRNSKTLKLARKKKKYCSQRRNKCGMKKKNREQKKRVHKLRASALSFDLLTLHIFLMADFNQQIQDAVAKALANQAAENRTALAAALAAQAAENRAVTEAAVASALAAQVSEHRTALASALAAQASEHRSALAAQAEENRTALASALAAQAAEHRSALAAQAEAVEALRTTLSTQAVDHRAAIEDQEARFQRALAEAAARERNLLAQIALLQGENRPDLNATGGANNMSVRRSNLSCTTQARRYTWWH
jgi:chemotaxis protein histidine kinase CheA